MSKRISRKLSFLVFALLAFAAIATAQTPAPVFKAGAARRDVTPREPVPMWGYGARHDALSVERSTRSTPRRWSFRRATGSSR